MLSGIYEVQIQPRKHVLGHADPTAPTLTQNDLSIGRADHVDQGSVSPEGHGSSIDHL